MINYEKASSFIVSPLDLDLSAVSHGFMGDGFFSMLASLADYIFCSALFVSKDRRT